MNSTLPAYIGGIVRILTTLLGGWLAQKGYSDQTTVDQISGAIVIALTGIWSVWAKRKALLAPPAGQASVPVSSAILVMVAMLPILSLLTGCAMTYNSTPIMSESKGETVVSDAVNIKIGFGTKEATSIGAYKLSADGGLSIDNLDSKSDSAGVLLNAIAIGAQLGGSYLKTQGVPVGNVTSDVADTSDTTDQTATSAVTAKKAKASSTDSQVAYSTDGYEGSPGAAGEGVYGRPSCSRCRAYKTAHPDAQIINIDDSANLTAMWAALRKRGFSASNAALPVAITADAYTMSAK